MGVHVKAWDCAVVAELRVKGVQGEVLGAPQDSLWQCGDFDEFDVLDELCITLRVKQRAILERRCMKKSQSL